MKLSRQLEILQIEEKLIEKLSQNLLARLYFLLTLLVFISMFPPNLLPSALRLRLISLLLFSHSLVSLIIFLFGRFHENSPISLLALLVVDSLTSALHGIFLFLSSSAIISLQDADRNKFLSNLASKLAFFPVNLLIIFLVIFIFLMETESFARIFAGSEVSANSSEISAAILALAGLNSLVGLAAQFLAIVATRKFEEENSNQLNERMIEINSNFNEEKEIE